jgi:hypothetical protein
MKKLIKIAALSGVFTAGMAGAPAFADTIAQWTFETSIPVTAGTFSPEVGAGSALGFHTSSAAVYSSPAGNGSAHSFSSNNWAVGDYYQFQVSTVGYSGITLSWDQTSSNTGPRDFQLQYSTNGTTFVNSGSVFSVLANAAPNPSWNSTTASALYSFTVTSFGAALDNQASAFFRVVDASAVSANGGVVATGGTDRIDNFTVSGVAAVPEPETYAMLLAGLGLLGFGTRRRTR